MIVVLGQFDLHPEDFHSAKVLATALTEETVKEDGCLQYAFAADLLQPNRLQLSECWRDDAALGAHLRSSHILSFRNALARLRVVMRVVKRYEVTGSRDL